MIIVRPVREPPLRIILAVLRPVCWVGEDIRADLVESLLIADDVFVEIALPETHPKRLPDAVDAFGGCGFERTYYGRQ